MPVDRGSHALLIASLKRIDDSENFGRVTASRGRVHHGKSDLLAGVNDEHGPNGEGDALLVDVIQILLVNHVVQEGNLAVGVGDDGKLHVGGGDFVDILDPFAVGTDVIGALSILGKGSR